MIPRSMFFWAVTIEAVVLVALLGILGFRRFFEGSRAAPETAEIRQSDIPLTIPSLDEPLIVVDKADRLLILYDGEREIASFPAALGRGGGDKIREGDCRTPEGEFYVCLKNPESRFVLSLGLSYPNAEDARRGLDDGLISRAEYNRIISALKQGRQPPWNTKLGGEIMIHGCRDGGRGTRGCIALESDAIRKLYPRIPVGTRVIIRR